MPTPNHHETSLLDVNRLIDAVELLHRYRLGTLTAQEANNLHGRVKRELPPAAIGTPGAIQEIILRDILDARANERREVAA